MGLLVLHTSMVGMWPSASAQELRDEISANRQRIDAMKAQQEKLLEQVRQQLAAMPAIDPAKLANDPKVRAQENRRRQLTELLARIEARIQEESTDPRKRYISQGGLSTIYSQYYENLRRKIERRGTENFPESGGRKLYGSLVMAILVNHDGRLLDARVVRGSGSRVLDRLAESIARSAAPFERFSPVMHQDADQLDITASFNFTRQTTLETTTGPGPVSGEVQDKLR
ncbi:TonB family protein [Ottowia sp.]|uniref:TonB family protein n=1 Tax=Ottowia sp. TaxID=1898956 RepID=UPI0026239E6E|nr:TonB family protein [Ottowia sp.]